MEVWRQVASAPLYEVSSAGRIRRLSDCRVLSPSIGKRWGYYLINLVVDGKPKTAKLHRLVCEAFHGPPPEGRNDVAHADGSRTNNIASNLRWERLH